MARQDRLYTYWGLVQNLYLAQYVPPVYRNGQIGVSAISINRLPQSYLFMETVRTEILQPKAGKSGYSRSHLLGDTHSSIPSIGIKSVLPSHSTFKSCARILSVFTHARSQMIHFPPLNPPMYQLRVRNVGNNSTSLLTYVST